MQMYEGYLLYFLLKTLPRSYLIYRNNKIGKIYKLNTDLERFNIQDPAKINVIKIFQDWKYSCLQKDSEGLLNWLFWQK